MMTTLPLADCSRMLGIHPKTLRHWLKQAGVPLAAHSRDARIKCVTEEDLQQVARLHGRPLPFSAASASPEEACVLSSPEGQALSSQENEAQHLQAVGSLSTSFPQETDLIQKLSCLETRVGTLEAQLAHLTLAWLQERERSVERQLSALETLTAELVGRSVCSPSLPDPQVRGTGLERAGASHSPRALHPAEQLVRSRRPPLIEYSAQGIYVIISSQEGELHLQPDSRAWFDWLATLSSFRFVGPAGRFTAHRGYKQGQQTHFWSASRCVRRHTSKHYLGVTESLTLASLEHVATRLQSEVDAR
jgi:hypothetical protein